MIDKTLAHTRAVLAPYELLVVEACSSDRTAEVARRYAEVFSGSMTRGALLNHGAGMATGDVLLFLHADTLLPPGAGQAIERALHDADVAGGAFRLRLDDPAWPARLITRAVNLRSALLNTFFGDQAMFVRREIFVGAGGYRNWSVMEDLEILSRLRRHGRLRLLDAAVVTSARRHRQQGWLRTITTIWGISLLNRLGVPGHMLIRLYKPQR